MQHIAELPMLKVWSRRWTVARGWQWQIERECQAQNGETWLGVFRREEPTIEFTLSRTRPRTKRNEPLPANFARVAGCL